jgi:hypothetical protein
MKAQQCHAKLTHPFPQAMVAPKFARMLTVMVDRAPSVAPFEEEQEKQPQDVRGYPTIARANCSMCSSCQRQSAAADAETELPAPRIIAEHKFAISGVRVNASLHK